MADVRLSDVTKSFGEDRGGRRDLDLHIADGEFVVLLGPTGAGKTTTLRLIAGLETPERGTIHIGGRDATRAAAGGARRRLRVPAIFALSASRRCSRTSPSRCARRRARCRSREIRRRVEEVAKLVRIHHKLDNRSTSFRAARCSASRSAGRWCASRSIYLMDEPLSSLDAKLRAELRLELKRIQRELGATVLYVTHDQIEAMTMADRIGILADGVLVQIGTPRDDLHQPANLHVAARLGQPAINLLPVGLLPDALRAGGHKTIGARTEHLSIEKAANGHADGTVDWVEHLGDQNHLHVTVRDKKLITLDRPRHAVQEGRPGDDKTAEPAVLRRRGQPHQGGCDENRLLHVLVDTSVAKKHEALLRDIKATGYDGVEIPVFEGTPDDYREARRTARRIGLERTAVSAMGDPEMNLISPDAATAQGRHRPT